MTAATHNPLASRVGWDTAFAGQTSAETRREPLLPRLLQVGQHGAPQAGGLPLLDETGTAQQQP